MTDLTFSRLSSQSLLSARDLQGSQQPLLTNYILTLMVSDISGFYCVLGDNSHRSQGYVHEQLALRRFLNMRAHKRFEHRPNPCACALTLGCDARESCPQLQKRAARLCTFPSRCCGRSRSERFHPRHEATSPSNMMNQKKCRPGKKPMPALTVIINISSNDGSSGSSGGSDSIR